MIARILGLISGFVAAVLLVTLALANRHAVQLVLDPFNPQRPVISVDLPFFAYLFGMLILGVILGGFATWWSQGKWRRQLRERTKDMLRWKGEADRLIRERDETLRGRSRASPDAALLVRSGASPDAAVTERKQLALARR